VSSNAHRSRTPTGRQAPVDAEQLFVDEKAGELLTLWRAMPYALARDSAGQMSGDRHAKGGVKGSPAAVNLTVVDASISIGRGLDDLAAEVVRLLKLDGRPRLPDRVIVQLPVWHRELAVRGAPLARYIRKDLGKWTSDAARAIGVQRRDVPIGQLCPDHRDTKPTQLLRQGDQARIAPSLLDGPPAVRQLATVELVGATCGNRLCGHGRCHWVRDRRFLDESGRPTDWVDTSDGPVWLSMMGGHAFTWTTSTAIRCPHCRLTWSTTTERRILAARLVAAGDDRNTVAAAIAGERTP
jgi:hypothetical protein